MRDKLLYWGTTGLAFIALTLVVAGIVLHQQNLTVQTAVQQRQQQIAAGQGFAQLLQGVTQNLAAAAVEKNDTVIRAMLEAEGLKFTPPNAAEKAAVVDKSPRIKKQ